MSSLAVGQRPFIDNVSQTPFVEAEDSNDFWTQRPVENDFESLLTPEVKIVFWRVLGGIALASAGGVIGLAACSVVALPTALLSIPALLLASYSFWHSTQIDDYDDRLMMAHLREEAQRMTLDEVVAQHGWEKIFEDQILSPSRFASHYRKQVKEMDVKNFIAYYQKVNRHMTSYNERSGHLYSIPLPQEYASKWRNEIAGNAETPSRLQNSSTRQNRPVETLRTPASSPTFSGIVSSAFLDAEVLQPAPSRKTFQQIVEEYPLDQLESLGMIERREMQKIRELLLTYEAAQGIFKGYEQTAEAAYSQAVAPFLTTLNQTTAALDAQFAANPAIRELEGLRHAETQSRELIDNQFAAQLREARELHQRNLSAFSRNGRPVARDNLSSENRAVYDRSVTELVATEQRIRQESEQRRREDGARFAARRGILTAEKERLIEALNLAKTAAKGRFNVSQQPAAGVKEETIRPDREQVGRIAGNLDQQYRAYLRQLAATR